MVRTGLEVLVKERQDLLRGRRVGLISHPAAVLPDMTHSLEALQAAGVRVTALFGMEHGFSSAAADGAAVGDAVDRRTGLPVYSLYGATREPSEAMLADVDVLMFDVQDVGVRYYTYISSLFYVLRAAGKAGRAVVVLDRPNPITGNRVEGPTVDPGFESFIGIVPMPTRHGMTVGELAQYMNAEHSLGAKLEVVPALGWRRHMWFDDCGLVWVPTSPAMPQLITTILYPGTCLIEGTNMSLGRGTAVPFEIVVAPWLDAYRLAEDLVRIGLAGVHFRPTAVEPAGNKYVGEQCFGVQIHVTDRGEFRPLPAALHVIAAARAQAPDHFQFLASSWEGKPPHFDLLAGGPRLREGLAAGVPAEALMEGWAEQEHEFKHRRQRYLLYD